VRSFSEYDPPRTGRARRSVVERAHLPRDALYCHAFEVIPTPLRLTLGALHGVTWTERITLVKDPTDLFVLPTALVPAMLARLAKVAPC